MRLLLLLLALLLQPSSPPPTLVLLAPERVEPGEVFRVNAAIFGDGSFDILLGLGEPAGFSTHDDLICSRRVSAGYPSTCSWWITAEKVGTHTIAIHVADVPAVRAVVRVGQAVWLPVVENSAAAPVIQTWLPMVS